MAIQVTSRPTPQVGEFSVSETSAARVEVIMARYPEDRRASGIIPLLDIAQRGEWRMAVQRSNRVGGADDRECANPGLRGRLVLLHVLHRRSRRACGAGVPDNTVLVARVRML